MGIVEYILFISSILEPAGLISFGDRPGNFLAFSAIWNPPAVVSVVLHPPVDADEDEDKHMSFDHGLTYRNGSGGRWADWIAATFRPS